MSSSSGAYFHQSCHMTKACVSLNWHQRRHTCRVLRRESWRSACCHQQCAAAVVYSPWCISANSVKVPLRKCGKWWRIRLSKFRSRQKQWRASVEDWRVEPIGVTHPCEKFLATPLDRLLSHSRLSSNYRLLLNCVSSCCFEILSSKCIRVTTWPFMVTWRH